MGSTSSAPEVRLTEDGHGFNVKYVGSDFIDDMWTYDFLVQPPQGVEAPAQRVRRSFDDVQLLATSMAQRYRSLPAPPSKPIFGTGDGKAMERYLRSLLFIEPWPRTNCFRQFLGIAMPPPPPAGFGLSETGPAVLLGHRIPMGALAILLSFCKAADALGICSRVCKSFQAAALHSSAWPSLKLCSSTAERVVDSLSYILMSTCANLQDLSLDLTFQQQGLSVAQPAELVLRRLRKLELKLSDPEGNTFAGDLLSCVESPKLKDFKLLAVLTPQLLDAVRMALLPAEGLHFLSLTALPDPSEVILGAETVAAIQEILDIAPAVSSLKINLEDGISGLIRSWNGGASPPGDAILQRCMAMRKLQSLVFDFMADDLVALISHSADRSWHLQCARFSGCKQRLRDPDQTLLTLLGKLSPDLQEFSFLIDLELFIRSFAQGIWGFSHQRLGPLPNLWQHREALRRLELNWQAFDDEGMACLVECCPGLEVLLLDRAEYWTDSTVQRIVASLPSLEHFRLRASSMLSDQSLYELQQAPHRLQILEVEPSYAMSTYMMDQLKASMAGPSGDHVPSSFSSFMAAQLFGLASPERTSPAQLRVLKPLDEDNPALTLWPEVNFRIRNRRAPREGMYIGRD